MSRDSNPLCLDYCRVFLPFCYRSDGVETLYYTRNHIVGVRYRNNSTRMKLEAVADEQMGCRKGDFFKNLVFSEIMVILAIYCMKTALKTPSQTSAGRGIPLFSPLFVRHWLEVTGFEHPVMDYWRVFLPYYYETNSKRRSQKHFTLCRNPLCCLHEVQFWLWGSYSSEAVLRNSGSWSWWPNLGAKCPLIGTMRGHL